MTKEEILRLEGRELDAAVAKKVMGWVEHNDCGVWCSVHPRWGQVATGWIIDESEPAMFWKANFLCHGIWQPSQDIGAAWLVAEKADLSVIKIPNRKLYWVGVVEEMEHFGEKGTEFPDFDITNYDNFVNGEALAATICKAALLADTIKVKN